MINFQTNLDKFRKIFEQRRWKTFGKFENFFEKILNGFQKIPQNFENVRNKIRKNWKNTSSDQLN